MITNLHYSHEPNILFSNGQYCQDPRDGLTLFGPYQKFSSHSIQAGVIGTKKGVNLYSYFVRSLQGSIITDSVQRPSYPGFEAIFGIKWPIKPRVTKILDNDEIDECVNKESIHDRTYSLVNLYLDQIKKVSIEDEALINIWFIIVPRIIWLNCRPKSVSQQPVSNKMLKEIAAGQKPLFPDDQRYQALAQAMQFHSDFHHQLKARLLSENLTIPIQIILEPTLEYKDKHQLREYSTEMKAHLAWTQSTTAYYKLGMLPWKLSNVRPGVCYLGLVYKKYPNHIKKGFACSAAQMFLDSGDGTIFRGNIGPWQSKSSKEFHLNKSSAKELLLKAIDSYISAHNSSPSELFIHGRARFSGDEWTGFEEAVSEIDTNINLVGIVIKESGKLRLFRDLEGKVTHYGNLRGLYWSSDSRDAYLWTRGFVPRLGSSISLEIPNPLRIQINKGSSDIHQVVKDIHSLTKLNYNACIFGDGLPVTLRFSDLVGSILTAVVSVGSEVLPFKYYI